MEIRPLGAELFHVDGRTYGERDMKLIVSFRSFVKAPNNNYVYFVWLTLTSVIEPRSCLVNIAKIVLLT
jgi:hypothetical protein